MKPLESLYSKQKDQILLTEYQENITQALHNIRGVIDLLEQSDDELGKRIALAHEVINSTLYQFENLDQKTDRVLTENNYKAQKTA